MSERTPRTAIVTGASSGIGAAIAHALGALGWSVAIGARRADKLDRRRARGRERPAAAPSALALDLADAASIDAFFDAAERALGPADVLVNNAGICVPGLLHEVSAGGVPARDRDQPGRSGAARASHDRVAARARRRAAISSSSRPRTSSVPRPFQPGYTASKWGLEGLARTLRLELDGTGIRSTIVRPGPTFPTDFARGWDPAIVKRLLETWHALGHPAAPALAAGRERRRGGRRGRDGARRHALRRDRAQHPKRRRDLRIEGATS